jgi:hypothetical protein
MTETHRSSWPRCVPELQRFYRRKLIQKGLGKATSPAKYFATSTFAPSGSAMVFVSQGIDTDSEQAEVLIATHGIVDSLYIKQLGKKTHRGVEGRALQGLHTGGRCFGYRSVPIEEHPQIVGVQLEIERAGSRCETNIHGLRRWRFD